MIIPRSFWRPISFFLSICLVFQTLAPALVYADDDATASASLETISPTPTETTSGLDLEVPGVSEGVDYRFRDTNLVVHFTKVTKPGKLTIREVKLTPEQIASTGALSDTAYDITSDMENGTFLYDLTLPLPQNEPNAKVEFASNADDLNQPQTISQPEEKTENAITIRGLDHFTIFFVTSGENRSEDEGEICDLLPCTINPIDISALQYIGDETFDVGNITGWPNLGISEGRYIEYDFGSISPGEINNATLRFDYSVENAEEESVGVEVRVFNGEEWIHVADSDYVSSINLLSYLTPDKLDNLKVRFFMFADPVEGEIVKTKFDRVILVINPSPPTSTFDTIDSPTNNNSPTLTGTATANGGATVKNVEYKVDIGLWISASPSDGIFNLASELFKFSLSALTEGNHVFETKVTDSLDTIQTEMVSLNLTVDTTVPDITVPTNITSEATSSLGAIVTFTTPTATDVQDGSDAVSCDKNSGDTFPLGLTTVHCSSTDTAGNTANKTFNVTIQDTTLPVITLNGVVADIEINHTYTELGATATDVVDVSFAATPTGSVDTATVGSYIITYNAVDTHGNHAIAVTRTVKVIDSIANAFAIISANLAAPGSDIANNLNLVNTNNVGSFSGLYFEKSIDGTPVGKLTFTKALNLSDSATQTFLQNLGSKLDQGNGRIALNATESGVFVSTGASLEMYDIMASVTSSNLVVRDDSGTALDPLGIISGFMYDIEANKVIFDTAHFTQFDIDTTDPTKPTATPAAGDYTSDQSVVLDSFDSLSGLDKIYYTTDGSTPDKTKTEYTSTITVDRDMTIKAIAYDKAGNDSDILEAVYGIAPKTSTSGGIGGSGVSDGKSVTPSAPVCNNTKPGSAPTLLSAFGGVNNVTLKWTEAADPLTYYLITYGTKPGAQTYGNPNIGGKGTTGYTVSGLSGGITYYFQVRAGNGCAPGDFSNEITATTQGAAIATETPAEGFAPDVKGTSIDLTPTLTPSIPGETNQNNFSWWLIFLLLATGGFGAWIFFRRR